MNNTPQRYHKGTKSKRGTRIFQTAKNGAWTYKCNVDGKTRYFPLGLDKKPALDLADQIRGHIILHPFREVQEMFDRKKFAATKDPTPTLGQILERFNDNQTASGMTDSTVSGYRIALRAVVRKVTGNQEVEDFSMDRLTYAFFNKYRKLQLAGITDQGVIKSRQRTINSKLRQIKALFSRPRIYDGYDLSFVDDIKDLENFRGLKKQYRLPPMNLIEDTFQLWHESEGDQHVLLGLALHFGFRRNEAFHARSDWFDLSGKFARATVRAELDFSPKGGHEGFVQGSKIVAASIINKSSGDDYLISNRADGGRPVYTEALGALREIGWDRKAPLHELRKLFGSYIASTEGLYTSQKFLRHADASTTNDSYADLIEDIDIKDLWAA
jgi:integrase